MEIAQANRGGGGGRRRRVFRYGHKQCLPDDLIVEEILPRLPVKSLIRFQCVSETWQSIILSPTFIAKHLLIQKQKKTGVNHLHPYDPFKTTVNYFHPTNIFLREGQRQVSFPSHSCSHIKIFSKKDKPPHRITSSVVSHSLTELRVDKLCIVGTSNGLVCIRYCPNFLKDPSFCIWNPATRKFKLLPSPQFRSKNDGYVHLIPCNTILGFSYVPSCSSYKLVQILLFKQGNAGYVACVEVLNVGENCWRQVVCMGQAETFHDLTDCLIGKNYWLGESSSNRPIVSNGCLHWLGILRDKVLSLLSFDLAEETFRQSTVPLHFDDVLIDISPKHVLAVFEDNLAMFESLKSGNGFQVWVYDGMRQCWTERFKFGPLPKGEYPVGFWEDRDIIVTYEYFNPCGSNAYLYDPNNKKKKSSHCAERECNLAFYPYVESLVQI